LLARSEPFFSVQLLIASLINSAVAVFLFAGLDRLRR